MNIFRYVFSAYITGYLVLPYKVKSISTVGYFISYFLLVSMSWMPYYFENLNYAKYFRHVQKIKHCLYLKPLSVFIYGKLSYNYFYIFSFCLVFKLYKSSLQILQFISGYLIFWGSVDIGGYLIVTLFERWILILAHFSDVFFWPVNCTCLAYISYHILGIGNVQFEDF